MADEPVFGLGKVEKVYYGECLNFEDAMHKQCELLNLRDDDRICFYGSPSHSLSFTRTQVADLVMHLQQWLAHGTLEVKSHNETVSTEGKGVDYQDVGEV